MGKSSIREIQFNNSKANEGFVTNSVHTTKYTFYSFIFVFLINELSRAANIFFCVIIIIQQFDPNDPNKFSTIVPLSIVLGFSAIKEIIEDLNRRNSDRKSNFTSVKKIKQGKVIEVGSMDLNVGDIIRVGRNERFPADLVLLSSSEPEGIAYLETSNIDGENTLKIRLSPYKTCHLIDEISLSTYKATLKCEQPSERIYKFEGTITTKYNDCFSLDQNNILLRGAVLKNTDWIYGIVVYTGHETKIMMNSSETPSKRTKLELKTDKQYFYISIGLASLTLMGASLNAYYHIFQRKHWYLQLEEYKLTNFIKMIFAHLLLLNSLVPISLSVTLEFIKLIMAILVESDIGLYDEETNSKAVARSSNLMEELGQVQCILTDKTGTLTCNEMILRHLLIDGEIHLNCTRPNSDTFSCKERTKYYDFFLRILATCHTVMIDKSDAVDPSYQGSSPDELAMVEAAAKLGYKFINRASGSITINERGSNVKIEVFAVIEFTSARKRMSIIALLPDGDYYIFCKGADTIILEILNEKSAKSEELKNSLKGLEALARDGLRTLCFAYRKLDKDFALEWLDQWNDALNTVIDRQTKIDSVAQIIETELTFIGATGVEDRLQEGVPNTIQTLSKANIKFWMLTGDRFETAVSTAFLSSLIQAKTIQFHLLTPDLETIKNSLQNFFLLIEENKKSDSDFALVINGPVIEIILSDYFMDSPHFEQFKMIAGMSRSLLCCRLSPLQKSQITRMARNKFGFVTLAVGDGGNDVSMIQAANIGIGISGKEGLQASRSADFSIAKFKYLTKLILVHGSWSLHRISRVIMYSIYKTFILFFTQFWYAFYNGASGQSIFETWMYTFWNILFTSWPPAVIGLTDQYVLASDLMENPQVYIFGQCGNFYDNKTFWRSALNAIVHSILIFLSVILIFPEGFIFCNQRTSTALMNGSIIFACILSVVSVKLLLLTNYWTIILGFAVLLSVSIWFGFIPISRYYFPDRFLNASTLEAFDSPVFWCTILLVSVFVLSRDFLWKFYLRQFCPHPYHIVQELKFKDSERKKGKKKVISENLVFEGLDRNPKRSRGFSFSQTYGQTRVLQAYGQSPKLTPSKIQN